MRWAIGAEETERLSGLVIKTHSGFYTVQTKQGEVICQLRGKLKVRAKKEELCVIGDRVEIQVGADGSGSIEEIEPRDRALSRVEPGGLSGTDAEREQVLVANPDQAVFVFAAANPAPHLRMLDRLLVIAEKATIPAIRIVVNKIDLVDVESLRPQFTPYEKIGYTVLYTSALNGQGVGELAALLRNQLSALSGPSGVGKSSLLNAVQPGLGRAVRQVSKATTKGRHTTVYSELVPITGGGYVADTPGIRSVLPWDVEPDELDGYFVEFRPFVAECRFADCTHNDEPGCAVRAAVEKGEISRERYESYQRLRAELERQYIY